MAVAALGLVELVELVGEIDAIASEMAASSALTAETIGAMEEGTALEMVTLSSSSSTMGESMAETTFIASETMGSVGGGIAESAEMTAEQISNSMDASSIANASLGQSVSVLSEFEGSAFEMSEFSPRIVGRQPPFTSTPFGVRPAPSLASSDLSNSLMSILDELEEDEFEESFSQTPRTLSQTRRRRTLNESTLLGLSGLTLGGSSFAATTLSSTTALGTGAAVTTLAGHIAAAIYVPVTSAIGAGVYKIVSSLEEYIPGAADFLVQAIESGNINLNETNAVSWMQLLQDNIGVMARLKAAGIDVAMLDDGRIHKVGSVISKVIKNNDNQISRIIHELPTSIAYRQSNLLRNLNTDIIREYWQVATTY